MSVSASINWTIHKKEEQISWVEIIQSLLANGWSLNDNGVMTYLPIHDNGMLNWQSEQINEEKLIAVLSEKEKAKESLGICITWRDSNIGGSLLTLGNDELLFSININRKTMEIDKRESLTDVNWYLTRTNSILSQNKDIVIIATNFVEHL